MQSFVVLMAEAIPFMISCVYSIRPFSSNLTQIKCDCTNVANTYDAIQCQLCAVLLEDLF